LSFGAIAAKISNRNRRISYVAVAVLFQSQSAQPKQDGLPREPEEETEETPEADSPQVEAARFQEGRSTRYAGVMMLFAALTRLGLFDVFQALGASAGPARQLGWGADGSGDRVLLRLA
jgi:hypothetical protein